MFLKKTSSKSRNYLQIVHAYKENGVAKHKVLANLGRFDNLKGNQHKHEASFYEQDCARGSSK
jgi:hypothetical protein